MGPVSEDRAAHLARHDNGRRRDCPRCVYYQHEQEWQSAYGVVDECRRAGPRGAVWLSEKPRAWGGRWSLGCRLCALAAGEEAAPDDPPPDAAAEDVAVPPPPAAPQGEGRRPRARRGTAWARFEVCPQKLQAEHIRQHADTGVHRLAVRRFLRPGEAPAIALQASLEDDRLLAGHVPQPQDWLRAWRAARTPQSWRAAEESLRTEHFIRPCRDRSVQARPLARMATILREVVRQEKRSILRKTPSISLSLDDRKGYKLVRCARRGPSCIAGGGRGGCAEGHGDHERVGLRRLTRVCAVFAGVFVGGIRRRLR